MPRDRLHDEEDLLWLRAVGCELAHRILQALAQKSAVSGAHRCELCTSPLNNQHLACLSFFTMYPLLRLSRNTLPAYHITVIHPSSKRWFNNPGPLREGECTNLIEAAPRSAKVPSTKTGLGRWGLLKVPGAPVRDMKAEWGRGLLKLPEAPARGMRRIN